MSVLFLFHLRVQVIFIDVILPLLVLLGIGYWLGRQQSIPVDSFSKLTIYLFVPSFLFLKIYESDLDWWEVCQITCLFLAVQSIIGAAYYVFLRQRNLTGPNIGALLLGSLVFNAGNVGIPLTEIFFQDRHQSLFADAMAIQSLAIFTSNITIWLFGYGILSMSQGQSWVAIKGFFKLPMVYVIVMAFLSRELKTYELYVPSAIINNLKRLAEPTIPIMLLVLGAQLATRERMNIVLNPNFIRLTVAIKLILLPLLTFFACRLIGIWPWPGAQLVIAVSAPTAVNTFLLSKELKGDSDTAASCIFWSTLLSGVSMSIILTWLSDVLQS